MSRTIHTAELRSASHGTAVRFRPRPDGTLPRSEVQRVFRTLCPNGRCACVEDELGIYSIPVCRNGRVAGYRIERRSNENE